MKKSKTITLAIENVPAGLRDKFKRAVRHNGITMRAVVLAAMHIIVKNDAKSRTK